MPEFLKAKETGFHPPTSGKYLGYPATVNRRTILYAAVDLPLFSLCLPKSNSRVILPNASFWVRPKVVVWLGTARAPVALQILGGTGSQMLLIGQQFFRR